MRGRGRRGHGVGGARAARGGDTGAAAGRHGRGAAATPRQGQGYLLILNTQLSQQLCV